MSLRPRVKICGLTRAEDAVLAASLGADALGFIFWPKSPRAITPVAARAVHADVPALVSRVGVFVDASPAEVADAVRIACLDVVQLHGDEPIDAYDSVGARVIKVTSLADDAEVARVVAWPAAVTPLVDAADPVQRGGTGRKADWSAAAAVAAQRSIVLAGGLTAANVADAIAHVRPWGLDVSSGVEDAPGIKSAAKLRAFFAALTAAVEREVM